MAARRSFGLALSLSRWLPTRKHTNWICQNSNWRENYYQNVSPATVVRLENFPALGKTFSTCPYLFLTSWTNYWRKMALARFLCWRGNTYARPLFFTNHSDWKRLVALESVAVSKIKLGNNKSQPCSILHFLSSWEENAIGKWWGTNSTFGSRWKIYNDVESLQAIQLGNNDAQPS